MAKHTKAPPTQACPGGCQWLESRTPRRKSKTGKTSGESINRWDCTPRASPKPAMLYQKLHKSVENQPPTVQVFGS